MNKEVKKQSLKQRRRARVLVKGTQEVPRLSVYRSLMHVYAQIIDDAGNKTVLAASDKELSADITQGKTKVEIAYEVGKLIAEKCKAKKVSSVVFDRGPFRYHGRVKRLAEGARDGGLNF